VEDGVDAIMLAGETAAGLYPARTVRTLDAIIRDSEASLFNRHCSKPCGLSQSGFRHCFANSIYLRLVKPDYLGLGLMGPFHQVSRLLYRNKVLISGHNEPPGRLPISDC